jgi:hypothetical protein
MLSIVGLRLALSSFLPIAGSDHAERGKSVIAANASQTRAAAIIGRAVETAL